MRVTIYDDEQKVSFLANWELAMRIVAGCSANPRNLEGLLLATEVYHQGISAWLMAELMDFDKAWQRQGTDYLQRAFGSDADSATRPAAFQVVDELTEAAAHESQDRELLTIDLCEHRIRFASKLEIPAEGQVPVEMGGRPTKQAVTYILPQLWVIENVS